jgi:hypothetical protein
MHDSLLLELFSPKSPSDILFPGNHVVGEVLIAPSCLLVSAQTLSGTSTQTRIELLEITFWMPFIYTGPMEPVDNDPSRFPWLAFLPRWSQQQADSLHTNAHIRDAQNTFVALLDIISNSNRPFCLNRIGSNPLEHAFGSARIK